MKSDAYSNLRFSCGVWHNAAEGMSGQSSYHFQ